jgi:hypothetical protein
MTFSWRLAVGTLVAVFGGSPRRQILDDGVDDAIGKEQLRNYVLFDDLGLLGESLTLERTDTLVIAVLSEGNKSCQGEKCAHENHPLLEEIQLS